MRIGEDESSIDVPSRRKMEREEKQSRRIRKKDE